MGSGLLSLMVACHKSCVYLSLRAALLQVASPVWGGAKLHGSVWVGFGQCARASVACYDL